MLGSTYDSSGGFDGTGGSLNSQRPSALPQAAPLSFSTAVAASFSASPLPPPDLSGTSTAATVRTTCVAGSVAAAVAVLLIIRLRYASALGGECSGAALQPQRHHHCLGCTTTALQLQRHHHCLGCTTAALAAFLLSTTSATFTSRCLPHRRRQCRLSVSLLSVPPLLAPLTSASHPLTPPLSA